jgi:hypothetical protein
MLYNPMFLFMLAHGWLFFPIPTRRQDATGNSNDTQERSTYD